MGKGHENPTEEVFHADAVPPQAEDVTTPLRAKTLASLVQQRGPFASVYLDTRADFEQAPKELELRWQALRADLRADGAPETILARLDEAVVGAHRDGDALVMVAAGDRVVLRQNLATPVADAAAWGPTPYLVPLLEWRQDNPTYAVALVDRTGAQIEVTSSWRPEYSTQVEGDDWPVRRINPGGWSQRRYQERAENLWEDNAKDVASALEKIASDDQLELVVISGDVRAVKFLRDNLSEAFSPAVYEIEGTQAQAVDEIAEELHKAVAAHAARRTEAILEQFREERGQQDRAVEGIGQTSRALSEARVETLIVAADAADRPGYVVAEEPTQVATDREALVGLRLGDVIEVPMRDALVRSALVAGSAVRVIPSLPREHAPADGVGAILRYTYT